MSQVFEPKAGDVLEVIRNETYFQSHEIGTRFTVKENVPPVGIPYLLDVYKNDSPRVIPMVLTRESFLSIRKVEDNE